MLKIRRLNMDSSWQVDWDGARLILDPWLIGSEVDGFSWFNEQWHSIPPVPPHQLSGIDYVVVTQSYTDHCHQATLNALECKNILATPKAFHRIKKEVHGIELEQLPNLESNEWKSLGPVSISYLDPGRIMDPVYYGVVLKSNQKIAIYFPHGFTLSDKQLSLLQAFDVALLITSFSLFKLPFFLGGAVNPGLQNAQKLISSLNPKKVVHTHDENKHAKGIVKKIAKINYPDYQRLQTQYQDQFVYLDEEYREYIIE